MSISFRRMRREDLEVVVRLEQQIFNDAWPLAGFETEVDNTRISYPCVAILDNDIIGYAVVWFYAGELHIGNIAVSPDFRRQGIGGRILEHLLDKFCTYESAFLEVRASNTAAFNLYLKWGFEMLMVRKGYYSDGEDALVMLKKNMQTAR